MTRILLQVCITVIEKNRFMKSNGEWVSVYKLLPVYPVNRRYRVKYELYKNSQ